MIELADIEAIQPVPGGIEVFLRARPQGETGHRERYTVIYDWPAAQKIANDFAELCAKEAVRRLRR